MSCNPDLDRELWPEGDDDLPETVPDWDGGAHLATYPDAHAEALAAERAWIARYRPAHAARYTAASAAS